MDATMMGKHAHLEMITDRRKVTAAGTSRGSTPPALGPVHKTALGIAVGMVCGLGLFVLTVFHIVLHPIDAFDIGLLSQYYYRYEVSWSGAFVGLFWGFVTGFVAGWFLAFVRNLAVAVRLFIFRGKAELAQVKDFLDQI